MPSRITALLGVLMAAVPAAAQDAPPFRTTEHAFVSHDEHPMLGRLTLPAGDGPHPLVVYVQTAEGMTLDMKRPDGQGGTFNYFDLYAEKLPPMKIGFFRYEGRGITNGNAPPRYERIDREVFDTGTLDNKVRDLLAAVDLVAAQPDVDGERIFLIGASEGSLLAAEAAARAPDKIAGLCLYGVMSQNMREIFRYILTDGAFLAYRGYFDTDGNGEISKEEFEADAHGYRKRTFRTAPFRIFDRNADGQWTDSDMLELSKVYLNAIDLEIYGILDQWAQTSAGVATPKGWFKDHFEHEPIQTFLAQIDIPVGLFHGGLDSNTPVAGVRRLEEWAREAGKTRMEFHYFDDLDHSLEIGAWFIKGELPAGHQAIFAFLERHLGGN